MHVNCQSMPVAAEFFDCMAGRRSCVSIFLLTPPACAIGGIQSEEAWLLSNSIDIVVSDVVPLPCSAANRVGVPCLCVSNFSWGATSSPPATT
jgi:hypothetical protein